MKKQNLPIMINLDKDFAQTIKKLHKKYDTKMCDLNGFSKTQLNYTDFIDNFVSSKTVADASIDGNANVGHKDVTTLENEMSKPHSKLLAFHKIFIELKKKYGISVAKEWAEEEWNGSFYLHDFYSATFKSYCYAYDLEPLVKRGLFFVNNFNSQPPRHLTTFTDFVGEMVSWCSNRTSGAVGLPNFLIYSYYFWKHDCDSGYFINSPEYYRDQEFQRIIYKLNQPYLRVIQSAFTNFSIFDREYLMALFGGQVYPDGTFVVDYVDEIIEYQKAFMRKVDEIRSANMMTFPVLTYALLRINGKFVDEEFAKWCCAHNMKWADSNFFVSEDVTSLSNCCRLVSDVKNLGYFNSIGGTALEVGSVKVNTINLARISYESKSLWLKNRNVDPETFKVYYLDILRHRTILCLKVLDRIRDIIKRNIEKGLLPNYSLGLINLNSQYNTIGISGLWEAIKYAGGTYVDEYGNANYTDGGLDFAKKILSTIHSAKDEFAKAENIDYQINIEQVPAERCATILQEKDKLLYPDGEYSLPLYGNQWIPLAEHTSLLYKLRASAVLDKACSGGSIAHINIDAPLTDFDTAWNLLNQVADFGVPYFAFCTKISACKNNHGFYGNVCPSCGEPKETTYQRVVGFLTPEKTYSKERKEEFAMRDWFNLNGKKNEQ